jgi:hypothetical protein
MLSRQASKLFEMASIERKRELIKMTHSNLQLQNDLLRSELRFPFDKIAECGKSQNWLDVRFNERELWEKLPNGGIYR